MNIVSTASKTSLGDSWFRALNHQPAKWDSGPVLPTPTSALLLARIHLAVKGPVNRRPGY